jgi:hypothetical protein
MSRINKASAKPGQPFCIEWPEWHISCAEPDCDETALISTIGMLNTRSEAITALNQKKTEEADEWQKRGDVWYCPNHASP